MVCRILQHVVFGKHYQIQGATAVFLKRGLLIRRQLQPIVVIKRHLRPPLMITSRLMHTCIMWLPGIKVGTEERILVFSWQWLSESN